MVRVCICAELVSICPPNSLREHLASHPERPYVGVLFVARLHEATGSSSMGLRQSTPLLPHRGTTLAHEVATMGGASDRRSTGLRALALAMATLATVALTAAPGFAGSRRLQPPPDVDLDPDRGMTFGRLPKTSFDRRVFDPMTQALGSRVIDPSIDPYNSVIKPNRYEPGTGKIRDSLTDKVREIRRAQESRRSRRDAAAARSYGKRVPFGQSVNKRSAD